MRYLLLFLLVTTLIISCNSSKKEILESHQYTNDLVHESSPYLLQHAHNPVNWKAWNETTLAEAKKEEKLMIISVGYSACHWCHVMEKESFEDSTVAAVMNANFINIKVDREERPDVDQIYINAVQLMTGSAGWPLNVITLPDGRPVWGGTYFKKDDWIKALEKMQEVYNDEPQKLFDYADRLEDGIKSMDLITLNTDDLDISNYSLTNSLSTWQKSFDGKHGGYNRAPKFMMPNNFEFLLRHAYQNNDQAILDQVLLTLDNIAYGGVYDHIGGGFARYSTDLKWHIPHFEKMLYDNAQLVSLYSHAYMITKKPLYQQVVFETLEYIKREMTHKEGAFYSSLDADSETIHGELEEGAYYTYTKDELKPLLGEDFSLFSEYYNINNYGKWEKDSYVLIRKKSDAEISEEFSISIEDIQNKKQKWKNILLPHRNKRPQPRLDDKTLTSWNGLMIKGYVDAYKAFQKKEYLDAALKSAHFIANQQLQESGALFHSFKDGKSTINGYLEDYAAVIDAYIALHEVTLDQQWINKANALAEYSYSYFFDTEKSMFYFTSKEDQKLVTRNIEYRDNVIPASNSIMAKNLYVLSHHFDNQKYEETAKQMLKNILPEMETYPSGFSNWLDLLANYQSKYYEIVTVGENALEKTSEINSYYIPNKLVAGSISENNKFPLLNLRFIEDETLIYICVNNTCKLPESDTQKALKTFIKTN
ncbi:MAG: thioredoxin domain-containing protein [Flavobacteriaceae bacterium]|nr:thioredoxin domain-containing protein [Flavobacteriaceae bacterium]